jgi:hypothetical protein
MTKRILFCLLFFLLFIACKKDNKPVAYNVTGYWSLYSYKHNFGNGLNVSVTQYPCMAANILTFNADGTASLDYAGTDTCFVTATHIKTMGAEIFGYPRQGSTEYNWSLNGNVLHLTPPGGTSIYGVISSINLKLFLTLKDTVKSGANTYYVTTVLVK